MQTTHELKVWPEYFEALRDGTKPFEVRQDDREFKVGDTLILREYNPRRKCILDIWETVGYTGEVEYRTITYILKGGQFGVALGYVVLGLGTELKAAA